MVRVIRQRSRIPVGIAMLAWVTVAAASPQDRGVAGVWESNWGPVTLQHGPISGKTRVAISGSWDQGQGTPGLITSGTYDPVSRVLSFKFYQAWNKENGDAVLQLSEDGDKLEGPWKHSSGSGTWTMTRQKPPQLKIDKLSVTYRNLLDRAAKELVGQATALSERREAIETEVEQAAKMAQNALEDEQILNAKIASTEKALQDTADVLAKLEKSGGLDDSRNKRLYENRDRYLTEIADLQSQIFAALRAGKKPVELEASLSIKQKALAAIEAQIAVNQGSGSLADLHRRLTKSMQASRAQFFDLRRECARLIGERTKAEATLRNDATERTAIEESLLKIGQTMHGLDLDLSEIKVSAGGKEVFHATSKIPVKDLDELNIDIEKMDKIVDELGLERQTAKDAFLQAGYASSDALNKVADLLHTQKWEKFGIDLIFSIYDVVYKGGKSGGLVGMVAETLKKVAEAAMFDYDWSPMKKPPGEVIDPVSIEAEVKRQFNASFKDSTSMQEVGLAAGKRMLKDTVFKYTKDEIFTKKVGSKLYENWEIPWRLSAKNLGAIDSVEQFEKGIKESRALTKNLEKMKGGYDYKFKNLAEGVAKDLLKTGLKKYLESQERDAWKDYFAKDIQARMLFPPYQIINDHYWKAVDARQVLLDKKAGIVAGFDPSGFVIDHSDKFDAKAELTIQLVWRKAPKNDSATVVLGDRSATGQKLTFTVSADGVKQFGNGVVELAIK